MPFTDHNTLLFAAFALALVLLFVAIDHFRHRDAPEKRFWTPTRGALVLATSVVGYVVDKHWQSPLWQKLFAALALATLVFLVQRWASGSKHPIVRRLSNPKPPFQPVSPKAYQRGKAAASWLRRKLQQLPWFKD